MPQLPYRFLAEMGHGVDAGIFWRFVADLSLKRHGETAAEIEALKQWRAPLAGHQLLMELWQAWEHRHIGEAEALTKATGHGLTPEKVKVLLRCRKREIRRYSRGDLLAELWQAWKDRNPIDYQKLRKRMEKGTT